MVENQLDPGAAAVALKADLQDTLIKITAVKSNDSAIDGGGLSADVKTWLVDSWRDVYRDFVEFVAVNGWENVWTSAVRGVVNRVYNDDTWSAKTAADSLGLSDVAARQLRQAQRALLLARVDLIADLGQRFRDAAPANTPPGSGRGPAAVQPTSAAGGTTLRVRAAVKPVTVKPTAADRRQPLAWSKKLRATLKSNNYGAEDLQAAIRCGVNSMLQSADPAWAAFGTYLHDDCLTDRATKWEDFEVCIWDRFRPDDTAVLDAWMTLCPTSDGRSFQLEWGRSRDTYTRHRQLTLAVTSVDAQPAGATSEARWQQTQQRVAGLNTVRVQPVPQAMERLWLRTNIC
jgi:hypothetical protein